MSSAQIASKLLLWTIYGSLLTRAVFRRRLQTRSARQIWLMGFFGCGAATLWGADTERFIDEPLGNLPIALFLKCFFILATTFVYFHILVNLNVVSPSEQDLLHAVGVGSLVFTIIGFVVASFVLHDLPSDLVRYSVNAVRDAVVLLFLVVAFLPAVATLFQREQILPMKVKHRVLRWFFLTYAVVCVGNLIALPLKIAQADILKQSEALFGPAVYLCFVLFSFLLLPHRWIVGFLYPVRVYTYYRLKRLEQALRQLAGTESAVLRTSPSLLRPQELELAIYQTVIATLDHYPSIQTSSGGKQIYSKLKSILTDNPDYPRLVQELAAIRL